MAAGKIRAEVKRYRKVNTFAELASANWVLLQNTEQKREGWFYECLSAIVVAAFKFEAYLNHLGNAVFPDIWSEMDRLSHGEKRRLLCKRLRVAPAAGRPWSTLGVLFKFRNLVAHGRSEVLDPPAAIEVGEIEAMRRNQPKTEWEKLCTFEFAQRAYEDTEAVIRQLHSAAGLDEAELFPSGYGYEIRRLPHATDSRGGQA